MSTLYSSLVKTFGEQYTKENILKEISPKVWWCNGSIKVIKPGNFWINETDTKELRVCNDYRNWAFEGYITPSDTKLISWNRKTDSRNDFMRSAMSVLCNEAHDVEFENFKVVYFGYQYSNGIKDLSFSNITLNCTKTGLSFQKAENINVKNITIKNGDPLFGDGLDYCYMNNSTLSYINVINTSDYTHPATGSYGLTLIGNNNVVHDYYINGTAWSGTNLHGSNLTVYNFTVINSGHNGFESQVHDSYFKNITVTDSSAHNFFQVSHDTEPACNNTYENLYGARPGSYNFIVADNSLNTLIKNLTFSGAGIDICDSKNITVINCTQCCASGRGNSGLFLNKYSYNFNEDHKVIDSFFSKNTRGFKDIWLNNGKNTICINTNYSSSSISKNMSLKEYYYADILVKSISGSFIKDAKVHLLNENDSRIVSVNGYGDAQTEFPTKGGQSYLPNENRQNSPAVASFLKINPQVCYNQLHTAKISTSKGNVSLSGITPDSSWYRKDPDTPTYTITAIIPDSFSKGPHIIGFAPSTDNPFNPGEKKDFRVWTDGNLSQKRWFVDGVQVAQGTLNYTWNVTKGRHTIKFIGVGTNRAVCHVWKLENPRCDVNQDGAINLQDLVLAELHFGEKIE